MKSAITVVGIHNYVYMKVTACPYVYIYIYTHIPVLLCFVVCVCMYCTYTCMHCIHNQACESQPCYT